MNEHGKMISHFAVTSTLQQAVPWLEQHPVQLSLLNYTPWAHIYIYINFYNSLTWFRIQPTDGVSDCKMCSVKALWTSYLDVVL